MCVGRVTVNHTAAGRREGWRGGGAYIKDESILWAIRPLQCWLCYSSSRSFQLWLRGNWAMGVKCKTMWTTHISCSCCSNFPSIEARETAANLKKYCTYHPLKRSPELNDYIRSTKYFQISEAFDAMQRRVFSPTHFKANGTKISQKWARSITKEACLAFHVYGKVPQTKHCSLWNGMRDWRKPLFYFSLLESPLSHPGPLLHHSDFWQTASAPGTPLPPRRHVGTNPV